MLNHYMQKNLESVKCLYKRYRFDHKPVQRLGKDREYFRDAILQKLRNKEYTQIDVTCPCCDSNEYIDIAAKERHSLPLVVSVCKNCGLVYNRVRLDSKSLIHFYEHFCYGLDRGYVPESEYLKNEYIKGQNLISFLKKNSLFASLQDKLVLEIGCGAGGLIKAFSDEGIDIYGCELSERHVTFCLEQGLNCKHGTLENIIQYIGDKEIGLIVYEQVMEHIDDLKHELSVLSRLLKEGTMIYIGVPGLKHIDTSYNSDFLSYLEIDHLVHFSLSSLDKMMEQYSFSRIIGDEVIRAIYIKSSHSTNKESDYQDTLQFIHDVEQRYRKKNTTSIRVKRFLDRVQNKVKKVWQA